MEVEARVAPVRRQPVRDGGSRPGERDRHGDDQHRFREACPAADLREPVRDPEDVEGRGEEEEAALDQEMVVRGGGGHAGRRRAEPQPEDEGALAARPRRGADDGQAERGQGERPWSRSSAWARAGATSVPSTATSGSAAAAMRRSSASAGRRASASVTTTQGARGARSPTFSCCVLSATPARRGTMRASMARRALTTSQVPSVEAPSTTRNRTRSGG